MHRAPLRSTAQGNGRTLHRLLRIVMVACTAGVGCGESRNSAPSLLLTPRRVLVIPDSFVPAGASVGPAGELVVWSVNTDRLIIATEEAGSHEIRHPLLRNPHWVAMDGDRRLFVAAAAVEGPVELRYDGTSVTQRVSPGWFVGRVIAATSRGSTWAATIEGAGGSQVAVQVDVRGFDLGRDSLTIGKTVTDEAFLPVLTTCGLSSAAFTAPFSVVGCVTGRSQASFTVGRDLHRLFGDSASHWRGLQLVEVPPGYLRTFSDVHNGRRAVVIYDELGRTIRVSQLPSTLSFIHGLHEQRLIVAIRWAEGFEAVLYEWKWN